MFPEKLWHWRARFGLLQNTDNLAVAKTSCFHVKLSLNTTFKLLYWVGGLPFYALEASTFFQ
jgi:hypothetical protein